MSEQTKIQWKDATSYSQSDKERIPQTWKTDINGYELIVTRIIHHSDVWFFRCRTLGIESRELRSKDIVYAKHEAILILKIELLDRVEKMKTALGEIDKYQKE